MISAELRDGKRAVVSEVRGGSWEGGNVWPPAFELTASLCSEQHVLSADALKTSAVLECGAGCGLVGIAAALLGARSVVLSDLAVGQEILRANVAANGLDEGRSVEVGVLDWTAADQPLLAGRHFDLIIASECLYDAEMVVPLLRTVHRACSENGTLLLAGMIGGEVGNFAAFGFCSQTVVSPLGAVSVIVNTVLAAVFLGERIYRHTVFGIALTLLGSVGS